MDYKECLEHMNKISFLNEAGLRNYISVLRNENLELKQKIIDLETKLQYKGK